MSCGLFEVFPLSLSLFSLRTMGCLSVVLMMGKYTKELLVVRVSSLVKVDRLTGAAVLLIGLAILFFTLSMGRYA